jgi:glycosyltransferase involved in cell wall biosynthesis
VIITALLQVYNEKQSGHLERYLKWNHSLYDNLVVLDDKSTDDSVEFIKPHASLLIENTMNSFRSELRNKGLLLNSAKEAFPDTDWFLWLDADELLLEERTRIDSLLAKTSSADFDGIELPLVNLWRSEHFYRIDSGFNKVKNVRFWKNTADLNFSKKPGLHHLLHPLGIKKVLEMDELKVLHFGFSSASLIANKFSIYRENGQRGKNLLRLIDETNLQVENINLQKLKLGSRFESYYQNNVEVDFPNEKVSFRTYLDLTNTVLPDQERKPTVTLISLIYAGVDWLEFQYSELLKLKNEFGPGEVEILFIANDASESVTNFLNSNLIPYKSAPGKKSHSEWYINSVYRAYNFGVKEAKGDYVLLTNSDMSYAPGFLYSMMQHRSPSKYLVGKLVESGRLKPANSAIKKNLGKTLEKFKREKFYKFANSIASDSLSPGGLFMPCLINRRVFLDKGGFPEGNIKASSLQKYIETGMSEIATQSEQLVPGDQAFIKALESSKINHQTVDSAVAYHFQEGEKSESKEDLNIKIKSGIKLSSITNSQNDIFLYKYLMQYTSFKKTSQLESELSNPRVEIVINKNQFSLRKPIRKMIIDIPSSNEHYINISSVMVNKVDSLVTQNGSFDLYSASLHDVHVYFLSEFQIPAEISKLKVQDIDRAVFQEMELSFKLPNKLPIFSLLKNKLPNRLKMLINLLLNKNN